jgi:CheY-like chemotaxis protein
MDQGALHPADLLLVKDNPGDARLVREILLDGKLWHRLHIVPDGIAVLAYLRHEAAYATAPSPDLVLLDLHLPRKDGWEVLAEMAVDDALRQIPVVILATQPDERDLEAHWTPPVVGSLPKPPDLARLLDVIKAVDRLGLVLVDLAKPEPAGIGHAANALA